MRLIDVFTMYGFVELWHPLLLSIIISIGIVYFIANGVHHKKYYIVTPVSTLQKVAFISGLLLYYLAEGSPMKLIGHHYLFSIHMLGMSFAFISAPPLILAGLPVEWLRVVLKKQIFPIAKFLTHPLIALFMFNIFISFFHFPFVFNFVMSHPLIMRLYDGILLITGLLMWWPVVSPVPELNSLSHLKKLAYIFAAGVLLTPACALIMFASHVMYAPYSHVVRLAGIGQLDDQSAGGVLMKIVQEITYIVIMGMVFLQWTREAKEQNKIDIIEYRGSSYDPLGYMNKTVE